MYRQIDWAVAAFGFRVCKDGSVANFSRCAGFKTMKTAYAMIKRFEVMRALRKGQGRIFNLTCDSIGEKRMSARVCGAGPCVMTQTLAWPEEQLAA